MNASQGRRTPLGVVCRCHGPLRSLRARCRPFRRFCGGYEKGDLNMADKHRPRRGSMGFSPRKRANRPYGTITAWPDVSADSIRVQGFAGWKAGMTHVLVQNTNPTSTSAGQEVRRAVTVVETPPMKVLGVRGYVMDPSFTIVIPLITSSSILISIFPSLAGVNSSRI